MLNGVQEPGKALAAKLCAHLRPKCHVLLLDASVSSAICVRRNIFQIALLAAMKLHCQVSTATAAQHMSIYIYPPPPLLFSCVKPTPCHCFAKSC